MSESSPAAPRRVLTFSTIVEAATGLALIADPTIVVRLLLGADLAGVGIVASRCFGIALLALALACWPGRRLGVPVAPAARWGMLAYNALIALYLAYVGGVGHMAGLLLWPAVALHAVVATLLARPGGGR